MPHTLPDARSEGDKCTGATSYLSPACEWRSCMRRLSAGMPWMLNRVASPLACAPVPADVLQPDGQEDGGELTAYVEFTTVR